MKIPATAALAAALAFGCSDATRRVELAPASGAISSPAAEATVDCSRYLEHVEPEWAVVVLVDRSGSRSGVPIVEVTDDLAALAPLLPPTTLIEVRWLSEDSYSREEFAVLRQLPRVEEPGEKPENPFDLMGLREFRTQQVRHVESRRCLQQTLAEFVAAAGDLDPGASRPRTDLYGGVIMAAETFSALRSSTLRVLILYSDLAANVGVAPSGSVEGLTDAAVLVRTSRAGGTREQIAKIEREFEEVMTNLGVERVEFSSMRVIPWHIALSSAGLHPVGSGDAEDS